MVWKFFLNKYVYDQLGGGDDCRNMHTNDKTVIQDYASTVIKTQWGDLIELCSHIL